MSGHSWPSTLIGSRLDFASPRSTPPSRNTMSQSKFIVRKVAVLGAGVMGAQIAAHLANANVEAILFDLPASGGPRAASPSRPSKASRSRIRRRWRPRLVPSSSRRPTTTSTSSCSRIAIW
ncbi:3-hydroxyacyl-CoA dehydrogenase NAD-binding domain-containing protein [Chitinimonas koreensis]|uniref:3-hydroxyacyl-CoA dehydrogenase NAD-binding domain-containing protein n=1 Tax=Chitinimonas koreensis TaxID=356302 RepID=UPI0035715D6A